MRAAGKSLTAKQRYRERWHRGPSYSQVTCVVIPENVTVLETHVPCTFCGQARGRCKHRELVDG